MQCAKGCVSGYILRGTDLVSIFSLSIQMNFYSQADVQFVPITNLQYAETVLGREGRGHEKENWLGSFGLCLESCILRQTLLDVGIALPSV